MAYTRQKETSCDTCLDESRNHRTRHYDAQAHTLKTQINMDIKNKASYRSMVDSVYCKPYAILKKPPFT